jgi:hypothetical protein
MRDQISAAVGPLDFLEEIWVNDIVNLVWETLRLRRLRAAFFQAAAPEGVHQIVKWMSDPFTAQKIAIDWASRKPDAVAAVDVILAGTDLTMDAVMAQTLALNIDKVERIDRMLAGAEARRNVALREMDRHRSSIAADLRQAVDDVENAEFKEIPPSLTEGEAA